jgi:glutamate formiminotransferase / 5-formyltetrahydrofolate cyclo-ligase
MTRPLVECVPNYSEGRRPEVIEEIVAPFRGRRGVHLLDYRADPDHNRLVVTLVGEPAALQAALLDSAAAAVARIDLRTHRGAHPRIGAVDVIPFIPIRHLTMEQCVSLARSFAERYAQRLHVPVYLYEAAACRPERRMLEQVRKGQFEALAAEGLSSEGRVPDFGPSTLHLTAGATAVGARPFLVAYNVNLRSRDLEAARSIARAIRTSSGGLPAVKAVGIPLEQRGMVQVSINLTDYRVTSIHRAFTAVREEAARRGIEVDGSEIYGLVPAEALIDAARHALMLSGFDLAQVLDLRLLDLAAEGGLVEQ